MRLSYTLKCHGANRRLPRFNCKGNRHSDGGYLIEFLPESVTKNVLAKCISHSAFNPQCSASGRLGGKVIQCVVFILYRLFDYQSDSVTSPKMLPILLKFETGSSANFIWKLLWEYVFHSIHGYPSTPR